jgi:hypothetical protein
MTHLTKLFAPIRIGRLALANRIVIPAMSTNYGRADGTVSARTWHYYAERARGGAGLIITETVCVAPGGKSTSREPCIYSDNFMLGLRSLASPTAPPSSPGRPARLSQGGLFQTVCCSALTDTAACGPWGARRNTSSI